MASSQRYSTALASAACAAAFAVSAAPAVQAQDYHPAFQPGTLKGPAPGAPNEVLVLGTMHLSGLPDSFKPETLAPLLDRLAAWRPTAIVTEDVSGIQCDALRRYPQRYAETVKDYCPDPSSAARAIGLDVPAANAEAERLLAAWPKSPLPAERRRLAAVFLAAGEPNSALVQWLRLPAEERHVGEGLNDELVAALNKRISRRNESGLIAAALAARLGLERVWGVDDHTADTPEITDPVLEKAQEDAIRHAWDNPSAHARHEESDRLTEGLSRPGGVLEMYRALNAADAPMLTYRSDFGAALVEPSPQQFGRAYVGYWETRNLRMVSNIRDVIANHPAGRTLAIVGASHKGYYEAYLDEMHDVRLVDPMTVLR